MSLYHIEWLRSHAHKTSRMLNGREVPARPLRIQGVWRWKAAWKVLRGHADAFVWHEDVEEQRPAPTPSPQEPVK